MPFVPPSLNSLAIVKAVLTMPWRGRWTAAMEMAPTVAALSPTSGPAALVLGGSPLLGTVDPLGSSTWVSKGYVRAVAGLGGWDTPCPAVQFHSSAGLLTSTQVYAATAQAVKELPPVDSSPVVFGVDDIRMGGNGPASAIFGDRDWHIDPTTGVVQVAPWPSATLDSSAVLVDWDGIHQRATLNSDALVLPGTTLTDPRFNGASYVVRSVEQTFTPEGSTVIADCSPNPVDRTLEAFKVLVRQAADTAHLKVYRYRFVMGTGNNLALQAITPGAPDLNPVAQYTGLSGGQNQFAPSTEIYVGFTADVPPQPFLISFSPLATPLKASLDASVEVDIGKSAVMVNLASATDFLVLSTPYSALLTALTTFATAMAALTTPPLTPVGTAGAALKSALSALPPPATTKVKGS